jgi:hypothetical protein
LPSAFLVEEGALMIVASTMVPLAARSPFSSSAASDTLTLAAAKSSPDFVVAGRFLELNFIGRTKLDNGTSVGPTVKACRFD